MYVYAVYLKDNAKVIKVLILLQSESLAWRKSFAYMCCKTISWYKKIKFNIFLDV